MKSLLGAFVAAFLLAVAPLTSSFAQAPTQLRFGLLPAEDPRLMVDQFAEIAAHVGKQLGLATKVSVSESYNALIEAMRAGHLEVVYLGGSQYIKMLEIGMDPVPLVVNRDDERRTYYKSCIIARSDSDIKTYADLKGKTFAFVAPTSTSGGIAPGYLLLKNGIDPNKDLKRVVFTGKHDSVALAVKNAKVDAGAVGDVYFTRWQERGLFKMKKHDEANDQLIESDLRIVGCVKVPNTVMVTRKAFGDDFVKKVQAAFMSVPENSAGKYRIWGPSTGFVATTHDDFKELIAMEKFAAQTTIKGEKAE